MKTILVTALKHAVNAALIALGPVIQDHRAYNLTTRAGLEHVGILIGTAVASREFIVWFPKLMQWSQTTPGQ